MRKLTWLELSKYHLARVTVRHMGELKRVFLKFDNAMSLPVIVLIFNYSIWPQDGTLLVDKIFNSLSISNELDANLGIVQQMRMRCDAIARELLATTSNAASALGKKDDES